VSVTVQFLNSSGGGATQRFQMVWKREAHPASTYWEEDTLWAQCTYVQGCR